MHGSKEIVLAVVKNIVVDRYARGDKLGDTALHQLLGELRVFELLANSHTLTCTHEFWQIGVEGMVGEAGKLHRLRHAIGTTGEGDAQNLRGSNSIGGKRLIEVAHAEKQHSIGVLCFHLEVLLHQWGLNDFLCHSAIV